MSVYNVLRHGTMRTFRNFTESASVLQYPGGMHAEWKDGCMVHSKWCCPLSVEKQLPHAQRIGPGAQERRTVPLPISTPHAILPLLSLFHIT